MLENLVIALGKLKQLLKASESCKHCVAGMLFCHEKKRFNPPAIKIIENEKYVINNNEHSEWHNLCHEDFVATINYRNSDVPEDPICKRVFVRSCESLPYPPKTTSESESISRMWNKNSEDELIHKCSEFTSYYPSRNPTKNEKSLQNQHKSSKDRLVQYDSHTSFDYSSKNTKKSEKSFKNLDKSIEHEMVQHSGNASFDFSSKNTRESKKSFEYIHKIRQDQRNQNDSKNGLDFSSKSVAKDRKLLRNRVKNNEDELLFENYETSLGYPSQNIQKCRQSLRKLHKKKEDDLFCKDFELTTKLKENDLTRKSSSIYAIWNNVKQIPNKIQPKRTSMSPLGKIKVVENPKYLSDYTPSKKELARGNPFYESSMSLANSAEKVQKDAKSSQDNISQCFWNVKSNNTDNTQEKVHSELENIVRRNTKFNMRDLVSESNEAKNERDEMGDQRQKPMSSRGLNPFESDDEIFSFEKDSY